MPLTLLMFIRSSLNATPAFGLFVRATVGLMDALAHASSHSQGIVMDNVPLCSLCAFEFHGQKPLTDILMVDSAALATPKRVWKSDWTRCLVAILPSLSL